MGFWRDLLCGKDNKCDWRLPSVEDLNNELRRIKEEGDRRKSILEGARSTFLQIRQVNPIGKPIYWILFDKNNPDIELARANDHKQLEKFCDTLGIYWTYKD